MALVGPELIMSLLILANSVFCFSLNKIYYSGKIFKTMFFVFRLLIIGFYSQLLLDYGIDKLFSNNFWFLISLISITLAYSTFWHIYYLLTREKSVLLGVELIDLFVGSLGFVEVFWYLGSFLV
jgi:hypothetical protein